MQPAVKISKLLEEAVARVSRLPHEDQEAYARWLLEEMKAEQAWEERFVSDPGLLEEMADEALGELRAGQAEELRLDER